MSRLASVRWPLALQAAAVWPVLRWYAARMTDGSDEPFGLIALLAAAVLSPREMAAESNLRAAAALTALYAVSFPFVPPLARAAIAVLAVSFTLSGRRRFDAPVAGLLILSLPAISSLQFYLGYPLRAVTATIVARIAGLFGHVVEAEGAHLRWLGDVIAIDAPCAGIRMLWTGLFLTFVLAATRRFGWRQTWLSHSAATVTIFAGNVIRTTALFFTESRIVPAPPWAHQAIGMAAFGLVAAAILYFSARIAAPEAACAR